MYLTIRDTSRYGLIGGTHVEPDEVELFADIGGNCPVRRTTEGPGRYDPVAIRKCAEAVLEACRPILAPGPARSGGRPMASCPGTFRVPPKINPRPAEALPSQ